MSEALNSSAIVSFPGLNKAGGVFDTCHTETTFVQSFSTGLSFSVHKFNCTGSINGVPNVDAMCEVLDTLAITKPFAFQMSVANTVSKTFTHNLVSRRIVDAPGVTGTELEVIAAPALILMNLDEKNVGWDKPVADIVKQIADQYGFAQVTIQTGSSSPEFKPICQVWETDYHFIVSELLPRIALGANVETGCELFSVLGNDLYCCPSNYGASEPWTPIREQILSVSDLTNSYATTVVGGGTLSVTGFDHYRKKGLTITPPPGQITYGTLERNAIGLRHEHLPIRSQDALEAYATQRFCHHYYGSNIFEVKLKNVTFADLVFPVKEFRLSGSDYRSASAQRFLVKQVVYAIKRNQLIVTVRGTNDKLDKASASLKA